MTHRGDQESGSGADSQGERLLGRYRVERRIGRGGMGEVLLAVDELLHRRVALKRVNAAGSGQAELRSTVLREARRASQINDRRIAAIYDVLELDDEVVLVMEYVDGMTLRRRMANRLTLEEFWDLASQCVEALSVAHRHGVVHRDIKPENLMVTEDHQIKILDFGIAKRTQLDDSDTTFTAMQSHVVAGTPQYMAPEAHLGGKVDERTDIFSLGVVFYELLTAKRPFDGGTYAAIADNALHTIPPLVSDLNPDAGIDLSHLVSKMLAKNPDERFASSPELMQQMQQVRRASSGLRSGETMVAIRETRAIRARQPRPIGRKRAWVYSVLSILGVVAAIASWSRWQTSREPPLPVDRNVAVLAPATPPAGDDFEWFALGASQLLSSRLKRLVDAPGYQLASFTEGYDEKVRSGSDARKVLGVRLALLPTLEQGPDFLRARLDLVDTENSQVIRSRTIETRLSEPFTFLDRMYSETVAMLGLPAGKDSLFSYGIRGAGTLRFYLQGMGRLRAAKTKEDAQRAVDEFELACRTEPDAAVVRAWLSDAQRDTYELAKDRAWLQKAAISAREAVGLDDARFEAHRAMGVVLGSERKYPESLRAHARAAELAPADGDAIYSLGRAYFRIGQPEKEKDIYLAAITRRPHCWQPHWWYATWCFRQGRVQESINAYEEMIQRAPLLHRGYSSLGAVLVLQGDYNRAIEHLRHSIELCPTNEAFTNLGNAYFNSRKFVEAIDAYNQSFQFGLASYGIWLNLGDAYFWLRDREDQAAAAYTQAVRLGNEQRLTRRREGRSDDPMIPANLASVFPKLGLPDSARVYLDMVLQTNSSNPMVLYCVALTHWQLHERQKAMQVLAESVQGGYPIAWLRDSPIFDEWREVEAFQTLLGAASPEPQVTGSRN